MDFSRRQFLLAAAAALVFPAEAFAEDKKTKKRKKPKVKPQNPQPDYSFLKVYDSAIRDSIKYFEQRHGLAPPINLIRAQIVVETGSLAERKNAFVYDPMQIASDGNALELLIARAENTPLIGDFSRLDGRRKAVKKNGKWDYSGTKMDGPAGVFGGVGWDYQKCAKYSRGKIVGWRTWEEAVKLYNGSRAYLNKVMTVKTQLDAQKV